VGEPPPAGHTALVDAHHAVFRQRHKDALHESDAVAGERQAVAEDGLAHGKHVLRGRLEEFERGRVLEDARVGLEALHPALVRGLASGGGPVSAHLLEQFFGCQLRGDALWKLAGTFCGLCCGLVGRRAARMARIGRHDRGECSSSCVGIATGELGQGSTLKVAGDEGCRMVIAIRLEALLERAKLRLVGRLVVCNATQT
jgi:hypothetical protein